MKKQSKRDRLKRLYNIVSHDEEIQSLLIAISCFIIVGCITLYCLIGG